MRHTHSGARDCTNSSWCVQTADSLPLIPSAINTGDMEMQNLWALWSSMLSAQARPQKTVLLFRTVILRDLTKWLNLKCDVSVALASKAQVWYLHEGGRPRLVGRASCLTLGCTKARGWCSCWDRWDHNSPASLAKEPEPQPAVCNRHQILFINRIGVD